MVKKIRNPETGRMVNVTGKIGQKVLSQRGGSKDKRRKSANRRNSKKTSNRRNSKKSQKKPNKRSLHGGRPLGFTGAVRNLATRATTGDLCVDIGFKDGWDIPGTKRKVKTCQDMDNIIILRNETEKILAAAEKVSNKNPWKPFRQIQDEGLTTEALREEKNGNTPKTWDFKDHIKDFKKKHPHAHETLKKASAHLRKLINYVDSASSAESHFLNPDLHKNHIDVYRKLLQIDGLKTHFFYANAAEIQALRGPSGHWR